MHTMFKQRKFYVESLIILAVISVLYYLSLNNYLLFHTVTEFFSIVICSVVFIITYNARKYLNNNYLLIIGYSYLFIGFLDFLHTLSYKGMMIFMDYDYYANQLWIAARMMQSCVFLFSMMSLKMTFKVNRKALFMTFSMITAGIIISIFFTDIFPECFIEGVGQTQFKIVSEYIIISILLCGMVFLYRNRAVFEKPIYQYLFLSVIFTALSELAFTFYVDNYGISNMVGHCLKILAFYFIYKAIIVKCIKEPYDTIFKELTMVKDKLKTENDQLEAAVNYDGLTGVHNRRYLMERIYEEIQRHNRFHESFTLVFVDVDEFKHINDTYGHYVGDQVLVDIGKILTIHTRTIDVVGRYGGDEFMVLMIGSSEDEGQNFAERIHSELEGYKGPETLKVTVSIGIKKYEGEAFKTFFESVDARLYEAKTNGKKDSEG